MTKHRFSPDDLRIASPCTASWEAMKGDERRRLCSQCNLHVYNVAAMTRAEVAALVAKAEGRLCMRLYRRADGTVITRDCPVGLRALRRRLARRVGAVLTALLGLSASVFGKTAERGGGTEARAGAALTLRRKPAQSRHGVFSGVVKDPSGAVIPGATVTLTDEKTKRKRTTRTNDEGVFSLFVEKGGRYTVEVEAQWFRKFTAEHVELSMDESAWADLDVTLEIGGVMGEIVIPDYDDPSPVKTRGTTTVLDVDALRGVRSPE